MAETEKPRAKNGTSCPFHNKDVSQVCHKCEFWEPLRVLDPIKGETDMWACAHKHTTFLLRDLIKTVAGQQGAQETFNNRVYAESQQNLRDLIAFVQGFDGTTRRVPALDRATGHSAKLIEGQ